MRRYCERTGRKDGITPFHVAFALFRLAVILEGVLARSKAGNASSDEASQKGALGIALAERGWELAQGKGLTQERERDYLHLSRRTADDGSGARTFGVFHAVT